VALGADGLLLASAVAEGSGWVGPAVPASGIVELPASAVVAALGDPNERSRIGRSGLFRAGEERQAQQGTGRDEQTPRMRAVEARGSAREQDGEAKRTHG
jgi:hypothetical protein